MGDGQKLGSPVHVWVRGQGEPSRADFLGDNKWPGYLPLCNLFSFVAPRGIIQPSELSEGVGLLEVASTGTMLRTIRKSTYREIEPPSDLLKYILMCRAKVVGPRFHRMDEDEEDPAEFWREWLTKKQDMRDIGYQVSKRLAKLIAEQIDAVHCENVKLKAENENYSEIREMLKELGLTPGWWHTKDSLVYETRRQSSRPASPGMFAKRSCGRRWR